jgi:hypothetical protein
VTLSALLVEPAYQSVPEYGRTLGPVVADLSAQAGFPPDPEQELALDAMFALNSRGGVAAFGVAVVCSRQNMKTGLFKMAALGWLFVMEQRLIVWSAHEMKTTKEAFHDLVTLIEGYAPLSARLATGPSEGIHRGNGDEAIELRTGQRIMFKARTNGGGRGLTGDKVILDEAFALKASHMGSLLPTLSARPDPQVVYGSSAGLTDSSVLRSIRDRGRKGGDPSLAYFEWCDDIGGECARKDCDHVIGVEGCRLDDVARWGRANPAMGRRISVEYIGNERRELPPAEFARERLGWWDEESGEQVINPAAWAMCEDTGSEVTGEPRFALDVAPSRSWAAIGVAGENQVGRFHVEVTSRGDVVDHRPGTEWVVSRFKELREVFPGLRVTVAAGSAAESLKPELEAAGIPVDVISGRDVAAGCGLLFDYATTARLAHLGQPPLDDALRAAKKRVEDGETAWVWGRKRSSADITPLYAATLALYAAVDASNLNMHPINNVW